MNNNINYIGGIIYLLIVFTPFAIVEYIAKDSIEAYSNGNYAFMGMAIVCILFGTLLAGSARFAHWLSRNKTKVRETRYQGVFTLIIGVIMFTVNVIL